MNEARAEISVTPEDRLMTVREVAAFLQVAEIFVYRRSREMGAFKVGSHLRFSKAIVTEWLESRAKASPHPECHPDVDNELVERLIRKSRERKKR